MTLPDIIQVEVTTACQAGCTFCPRTPLRDGWISKHIEWSDFAGVLPLVKKGTLVHLQGWGEPLLHPHLWDMAAAVRQQKGSVSLTTNGGLLDEAVAREICRTGFKFIAVSLAGATASLHDKLRPGPGLDVICANIEQLSRMKGRPPVHIAFQMMKPNLEQLPGVVSLAASIGADRVIASNLDCIAGPEMDRLRVFGQERNQFAEDVIAEAMHMAREKKIAIDIYPLRLRQDVPVCEADPLHTVFVTSGGEIAPCVYTRLPLQGDIPRYFEGRQESIPPFSYGRVGDGFEYVIKGKKAREFTGAFERRNEAVVAGGARGFALLAMPGLRNIQTADIVRKQIQLPAAPEQCRFCYKLFGI